jgi:putative glycosyltransferase (TIGR04372 family)
MFIKIFIIKILQKKNSIKYISLFNYIFSNDLILYVFKNSIRTGQFEISHKLYNILSKKKLTLNQSKKFFISKVVYFEVNLFINSKFNVPTEEKKYYILKKFIKSNFNSKKKFLSPKNFFLTKILLSKIVKEFVFCDSLIPIYKKYLETEYFFNFAVNKNNLAIELDYHWFKAIGHYFILDTLIKAIFLKLISVKKIYFKIEKNKIANLYLYNFYRKFLIKNNLFLKRKKKNITLLNMNLFYIKRLNTFYESNQVFEYIQAKWKNNYFLKKNFLIDTVELDRFNKLKKKFFGNSKIITIHIRQKGFHAGEDENCEIRNSDLNSTLEALNSINSSFLYVLLGGSNMPKIDKKFTNIFNYARSKLKSELNDVLLIKYCDAHIGTWSGITHFTLTSHQPTLLLNWHPFNLATKNESSIILPKLLKQQDKIFSIKDFNKIKPGIFYGGFGRLDKLGITHRDNTKEEIFFALDRFVKSLSEPNWKNYGVRYIIENKNFDFHCISKDKNKDVLNLRKKVYFDPYFIKCNKGFL